MGGGGGARRTGCDEPALRRAQCPGGAKGKRLVPLDHTAFHVLYTFGWQLWLSRAPLTNSPRRPRVANDRAVNVTRRHHMTPRQRMSIKVLQAGDEDSSTAPHRGYTDPRPSRTRSGRRSRRPSSGSLRRAAPICPAAARRCIVSRPGTPTTSVNS